MSVKPATAEDAQPELIPVSELLSTPDIHYAHNQNEQFDNNQQQNNEAAADRASVSSIGSSLFKKKQNIINFLLSKENKKLIKIARFVIYLLFLVLVIVCVIQ